MNAMKLGLLTTTALLATACGSGSTTYSLLGEGQTFHQSSALQLTKIDILWVVDNSGSMETSQTNLANNFPSFIQKFTEKTYDFQMGVVTTDAYLALPMYTSYYNQSPMPSYYGGRAQSEIALLRDGTWDQPSGFRLMNMNTPNLSQVFIKNAMQGIAGRGDERSLQSMTTALSAAGNSGFVRDGSFLAVIVLTDEDDFSNATTTAYERYDRPLTPIADYVTYLDNLTKSSGATRRYSFNSIAVNDQTCLDSIYSGAQKIGLRVGQLSDATGGVKANICGNFANELQLIAKSIVELSTQFYLEGDPVPESVRVYINGAEVPRVGTPGVNGGFYYNEPAHSVVFQGDYIPPQSANINVTFDPRTINF